MELILLRKETIGLKLVPSFSFIRYLFILLCFWLPLSAEPIKVADDLNNLILLGQPAKKIIALSPHLAELVFDAGAGEQLVATVEYADYPSVVKSVSRIGAYNALDKERLVALQPDIVLLWLSGNGEDKANQLKQLGINVYISEPRNLSDISKTILDIGKLAGSSDVAQSKAMEFDRKISHLQKRFGGAKPVTVFYQVWGQPLITVNQEQLINEVIELCGGINVFSGVPVLAPVVSTEELIVKNPQVIIGGARQGEKRQWLQQWKNWPSIKAVKNNHLYFISPDLLNRQTTRMLEGAGQLCTMLDNVRHSEYD